ncbi:MAG: glycine cleavage system protein GcvH [Acidobacteria bacterium]|nr:glycine cleavage system protein GcvH [Acidobacteriota bacterium]
MYPDNLRYTKDHEWVSVKEATGTIGVTHFAQKELGDVVFVELPEVGKKLKTGDEFGTIESVKAVSEVYAPVTGEVVEVNGALVDHPEIVNEDPYGRGWILKVRMDSPSEAAALMDARGYQAFLAGQKH